MNRPQLPRTWVWEDGWAADCWEPPVVQESVFHRICDEHDSALYVNGVHFAYECQRRIGHTGRHVDYDEFGRVRAVWERKTP